MKNLFDEVGIQINLFTIKQEKIKIKYFVTSFKSVLFVDE